MRAKTQYKHLIVRKEVYERLQQDRKHFQDVIAGGKWSLSDTIEEYHKILDTLEDQPRTIKPGDM